MPGRLFREIATEFLEHYLLYSQDLRTMPFQIRVLERHFGDLGLAAIGPSEIEHFMAARLAEGVTRATINRQRAALSVVLEWAIGRGYREGPNPVRSVKKFREGQGRTRYLTADEAARLTLAAAPHLKPLVTAALYTGGRLGELLALRWGDVDFDGGVVTFRRETAKAKKTRTVPMAPGLRQALAGMRRGRPDSEVFVYAERPLRSVKTSFGRATAKAGLGRDVTFHVLRHTFASWYIQNGGDVYRLRTYLGHHSVNLTMRYAHLSREHLEDGARFIGPPGVRRSAIEDDGRL